MSTNSTTISTMKRLVIMVFVLILGGNLWAQTDSISTIDYYNKNNNDDEAFFDGVSYRIGLGLLIPSSKEHFRTAVFFEYNMNIPISDINSIEFAAQLGVWDQENNFNYVQRLDSVTATSRVFLNGLFKFKKDIVFFKKSFVSIGAGIGFSAIFINIESYSDDDVLEEVSYETMTSVLLSPELEYVFDISDRTQFSLSFSVQYADYKFKSALQNDIGKWYYLPKVTYRF